MVKSEEREAGNFDTAYRNHERKWKGHRYVYAVISRRSRGVSVGINLNPGKECNFNCIYCQVDRRISPPAGIVDPGCIETELDAILQDEKSGSLYETAPFNLITAVEKGVRDIAFSGNGEPTASPCFDTAVRIAARGRQRFELNDTKIVLITNASLLDKPEVCSALAVLDENNGEIWAKLDAGTEEYFHRINRSKISLQKILGNILKTASIRPLIIQSLWLKLQGTAPSSAEIEAYCSRLNNLLSSGAQLKGLQLYTIARTPLEQYVSPLTNEELDRIADRVRGKVPVPVEVFYGVALR